MLTWQYSDFKTLSLEELYQLLLLRQRVFVQEQNCPYADIDGVDPHCFHLMGWIESEGRKSLAAYARILPKGLTFPEHSIGRIVTAPEARRKGLGKALVQEAISLIRINYGKVPIRILAQRYLEKFYGEFGFSTVSEPFLVDGIPHIEMLLQIGDLL